MATSTDGPSHDATFNERLDQCHSVGGSVRERVAPDLVEGHLVTEIVHPEPVWRGRADHIIGVQIESEDPDPRDEQLWARKESENEFTVCCIPFFAYNLALGDRVEVDRDFQVKRVTAPSGRYVFRFRLDGTRREADPVVASLLREGALLEWSSENLAAVDAQDELAAQTVADILETAERAGTLIYETGRL